MENDRILIEEELVCCWENLRRLAEKRYGRNSTVDWEDVVQDAWLKLRSRYLKWCNAPSTEDWNMAREVGTALKYAFLEGYQKRYHRTSKKNLLESEHEEKIKKIAKESPLGSDFEEKLEDEKAKVEREQFERNEWFACAIASLKPDVREIVTAKIQDDLTFDEIAKMRREPRSSIHRKYQEGITYLRIYAKSNPL